IGDEALLIHRHFVKNVGAVECAHHLAPLHASLNRSTSGRSSSRSGHSQTLLAARPSLRLSSSRQSAIRVSFSVRESRSTEKGFPSTSEALSSFCNIYVLMFEAPFPARAAFRFRLLLLGNFPNAPHPLPGGAIVLGGNTQSPASGICGPPLAL